MDVKNLEKVKELLAKQGFIQPNIDDGTWNAFVVNFTDFLRSSGGKSVQKQAVYVADLIVLSYPYLYHNMEENEWYLPKLGTPFVYWRMGRDEVAMFVATFIRSVIPVLYSSQLARVVMDTLMQDIRIIITPDQVDPKGYFVFKNGVLDMASRELIKSVDGIFTKQYPFDFNPNDEEAIKRADEFIKSFVYRNWPEKEKQQMISLLYECLLYGCQQKHTLKKVFVFYGDSNTGKSTFPKIWSALLGKRYVLVPEDADKKINDTFFLYSIHQAQVVHMDEVNGKSRRFRDFIKAMSTTQTNTVVRKPGGESKIADVSCLLTFTTNSIFKFKESSSAMFNRLMPIHFAQVQEVKLGWDIDEILDDRMQVDIITAMVMHTKNFGTNFYGRDGGWSMPSESIRLRESFCENEDDETSLFRGRIVKATNWIRTNDVIDKLNSIIYAHNAMTSAKEEHIDLMTRVNFEVRFRRICGRLGIEVTPEKSQIVIEDPKNPKNKQTLLAAGWSGFRFVDRNTEAISEWEKLQSGMLDPEDELVDDKKTPFDPLF